MNPTSSPSPTQIGAELLRAWAAKSGATRSAEEMLKSREYRGMAEMVGTALIAARERGEKNMEWVSVEDRLPEPDRTVAVLTLDAIPKLAHYFGRTLGHGFDWADAESPHWDPSEFPEHVVAWAPLPLLPEEREVTSET